MARRQLFGGIFILTGRLDCATYSGDFVAQKNLRVTDDAQIHSRLQ
jgi:hypothetical protein